MPNEWPKEQQSKPKLKLRDSSKNKKRRRREAMQET